MKASLFSFMLFNLLIACTSAAGELQDFELQDQYGQSRVLCFPKTKLTIMAVCNGGGANQLTDWIRQIYARYQKLIDIDGVADVSAVPKILRPLFLAAFRKQVTYSVMLDWNGSVVGQFTYQKDVANIYLIDRAGGIAERFAGEANPEALQLLFRKIDTALATD